MEMTMRRIVHRVREVWGRVIGDDRGDVPGWVLVTLVNGA